MAFGKRNCAVDKILVSATKSVFSKSRWAIDLHNDRKNVIINSPKLGFLLSVALKSLRNEDFIGLCERDKSLEIQFPPKNLKVSLALASHLTKIWWSRKNIFSTVFAFDWNGRSRLFFQLISEKYVLIVKKLRLVKKYSNKPRLVNYQENCF